MTVAGRRILLWGVLGLLLAIGLFFAFRPQTVLVDLVELQRGLLFVTIDEEGETRIRDVYILSAPVGGRALRIDADVGDPVVANETVIAEIEPIDPAFLDQRSEAQARADVRAAESAKMLAKAEVDSAQAELDFASTELKRLHQLVRDNLISERTLNEAERTYKTRKAALATAIANLQVRSFELERARAQLLSPAETHKKRGDCACVPITAPVNGQILRVLHESEGVVSAGEALVEIGDPHDLEIVSDFLSTDAVKAGAGQRVIIEGWGGEKALEGHVRRVEPFGFTKVSALGIEEQRVNIIIDFTSPAEEMGRLGHGYRVETRVVLSETGNALKLPLTALFRHGTNWAVYVAKDGRARLHEVEVGQRNDLEAEVIAGLEEGERIIAYPSDRISDGTRVEARK